MAANLKTERPTRPILRYHGGKWRLARWVVSFFPEHRVYVEPYGGAGSVLMQKPRTNGELISDLDGEVISLFRVLRDPSQARELERLLTLTPYGRAEYEAAYLPAGDPIEQARRTLIKSFMGFGSDGLTATWVTGFRDNLTRGNGTPARDWANYPEAIAALTERLKGVVIENRPALQIIKKHDTPRTLFYCDPPYAHSTRAGCVKRKHSYRFEMSDDEHREMAEALHQVKGMVVLSGYGSDLYDKELFPDWRRFEKTSMADSAQPRTEVLWLNDAAWSALNRERTQTTLFEQHGRV
jgi:DNA adenine methylase